MALLSILQRAALALPVAAIVAAFVASAVHVDGADDNNNDPRSPPSAKRKKVRAKFVNQLPDAAVELFWEDHRGGDRRLEGRLRPRGGWHVSNTFAGHGELCGILLRLARAEGTSRRPLLSLFFSFVVRKIKMTDHDRDPRRPSDPINPIGRHPRSSIVPRKT
jgi:hypothetical protein